MKSFCNVQLIKQKKEHQIFFHYKAVAKRCDKYHLMKNSLWFLNIKETFPKGVA